MFCKFWCEAISELERENLLTGVQLPQKSKKFHVGLLLIFGGGNKAGMEFVKIECAITTVK